MQAVQPHYRLLCALLVIVYCIYVMVTTVNCYVETYTLITTVNRYMHLKKDCFAWKRGFTVPFALVAKRYICRGKEAGRHLVHAPLDV